jgi:hypothetical protein
VSVIALINVFPPLYEIGQNMSANFMNWGDRRKHELTSDESMAADVKAVEVQKVVDKMVKYKEKMNFLDAYQTLPRRESHQTADALAAAAAAAGGAPPRPVRRASIRPSLN